MLNKKYWYRNYNDIKNILKIQGYNTKYFNFTWFLMFVQSWEKMKDNFIKNIDDSYYKDNILLYHCYDPVYNSDFYNKNNSTYCNFLSIFYGWQKEA